MVSLQQLVAVKRTNARTAADLDGRAPHEDDGSGEVEIALVVVAAFGRSAARLWIKKSPAKAGV